MHPPVLKLSPVALPAGPARVLAPLGGRAFEMQDASRTLILTAPGAADSRLVIVPRGLGRPTFAERDPRGFRSRPTGEVCAPRRWLAAGGVCALISRGGASVGPRACAPALPAPDGPPRWLAIRIPGLDLIAAAGAASSAEPVAVLAGRVRAVSAAAAARGVCRGMSAPLARRRCPGLRMVAPGEAGALLARVAAELEGELGSVRRERRTLLVQVACGARHADALSYGGVLARRLWQAAGVTVAVAIAGSPDAAARLARLLEAGDCAVVPKGGEGPWSCRGPRVGSERRSTAGASWWGPRLEDIEGAVAEARALAFAVAAPCTLDVAGPRGRIRVRLASAARHPGPVLAAQAEEALRRAFSALGGCDRVELRASSRAARPTEVRPRQLVLASGLR
jgi:hypothetical protein